MPSVRKYNKKGGSPLWGYKIPDLKNVNFASFSSRGYNGVLWKMHFSGTFLLHKNLCSAKTGHIFFFQKLTQYDSMIEVYIKAKKMGMSPTYLSSYSA